MPSTLSRAATKCISDVPGLVKHTFTPPPTNVRTRLSAPFMLAIPSHDLLCSLDALVDLDTVSGVFGHIEPTCAVNPHRDWAPEAFLGLKVGRVLALGGHIWAGLDELLSPLGEGGVAGQRGHVHAVRPQDLHPFVPPVRDDDVPGTIDADPRWPAEL